MTLDEMALVAAGVDGGCPTCISDVAVRLQGAFPRFLIVLDRASEVSVLVIVDTLSGDSRRVPAGFDYVPTEDLPTEAWPEGKTAP